MIIALALLGCSGPAPRANADSSDWPTLASLDRAILDEMEYDRVPGLSACILKDGEVVWCQGYGYADLDTERPVTTETPFLLASVSKAIVGIALARAWEEGHLSLDEPVETWLPFSVRHPDAPNSPITPRMIAAHVSGIDDNWNVMDSLYTDGDPTLALSDFMEGYLTPEGRFYNANRNFVGSGPKDTYAYSNIGAALTGLVIEEATGTPFHTWCNQEIFAPLGLKHTAWYLSELDAGTVALPYEWRLGHYTTDGHYGFPDYPSGQLRASAEDTAALLGLMMRDGGGIISPDSVDELLAVPYPSLEDEQGLFWYDWTLRGETVWGHNGGELGASTEIVAWDDGIGAVVLMNAEGYDDTLSRIERLLHEAAADL